MKSFYGIVLFSLTNIFAIPLEITDITSSYNNLTNTVFDNFELYDDNQLYELDNRTEGGEPYIEIVEIIAFSEWSNDTNTDDLKNSTTRWWNPMTWIKGKNQENIKGEEEESVSVIISISQI
jgi:hypothetical protein